MNQEESAIRCLSREKDTFFLTINLFLIVATKYKKGKYFDVSF